MILRTTGWMALSVIFLALSGSTDIAESKTSSMKPTQPVKKQAQIEGFRSAKFGMKEKHLLQAIKKDFKIEKNKVVRTSSALEKTTSLEITVPQLLGTGGTAKVAYILGYKTKRLIHVNILWGNGAAKEVNPKSIVDTANFLRSHLNKKKYEKDGLVLNGKISDSMTIVFRGKDKKSRMALLVLTSPVAKEGQDAKKAADLMSLRLTYVLDNENPDIRIIKIKDGDF
jgi:hypothetical protein